MIVPFLSLAFGFAVPIFSHNTHTDDRNLWEEGEKKGGKFITSFVWERRTTFRHYLRAPESLSSITDNLRE